VSRWLDWTVRAVAVASFVLGGVAAGQVWRQSQCQARFNERAVALTPAANREREAERMAQSAESALWLGVSPDGSQTPAEEAKLRALFAAFQATLTARARAQADADAARVAHPLPTCAALNGD